MAALRNLNNSSLGKFLLEKRKKSPLHRAGKNVRNLMTTVGNYLLVWEPEDCCLLIKNLLDPDSSWTDSKKTANEVRNDCYMKISLTDPPVFQVEDIQASLDGSHVVLSGCQGVACVELPSSWTNFDTTKTVLEKIAKSYYIGEKQLLCVVRIRVQQVKWHPGSPTNSHVIILTSDSNLRIYDINHPNRPEKTIPVGPCSNSFARSASITTFSSFIEDIPTAFDFGLPFEDSQLAKSGRDTKSVSLPVFQWPVYVLMGNGDVYTFLSSLQSNRSSKTNVRGPLVMWPPAEDNYGTDACSILCLNVSPPVLVIANQHGNIHQAVLLSRDVDADESIDGRKLDLADDGESIISWASLANSDMNAKPNAVLYVTEILELDGDILGDANYTTDGADELENSGAVKLLKDPSCSGRYFISHDYGVHTVVVPLVTKLSELASKPDGVVNPEDTKQLLTEESVVEFILCTRMKNSELAPPQGAVMYPLPPTLIILLDSADIQAIGLSLLLKPSLKLLTEGVALNTKKVSRESFDKYICRLLQRAHSQPKLSLPPGTELPVSEVVKLFSRCVQVLREEYIMKQDAARDELEKRTRLLRLTRQQQLDELDLIHKSKTELTDTAHRLAEKYEDAKEAQERFILRVEKLLFEIQRRSPVLSDAEKEMGSKLRQHEAKVKNFRQSVEALRRKEQLYSGKASQTAPSSKNGHLNEQQRENLHEILAKQSQNIEALIKDLQILKKDVGV